ncbi:hypothetical protein [Falsirhodobacter xinxiangensis]|uniref:hypothetical protein n=1 Tax=Falsirhodobacter xinxiangensis TaxID=2530049 RepID=UPI0010AA4B82|nr:hypothetical protein [Rhodobacter xinxiangensis]
MAQANNKHRRAFLKGAPAVGFAALLVGATPAVAATPRDPVIALIAKWKAARSQWDEAAASDQSGASESAECLRLEDVREALACRIHETAPTTAAGIAALMEFAWIDCGADYMGSSDWIDVNRSVVKNIMEAAPGLAV